MWTILLLSSLLTRALEHCGHPDTLTHHTLHPLLLYIRRLHGCGVNVHVKGRGRQVRTVRTLGTQNPIPGEDNGNLITTDGNVIVGRIRT